MSSSPYLRTSDISLPVLQSATSHRVSPQLGHNNARDSTGSGGGGGGGGQGHGQLRGQGSVDNQYSQNQTQSQQFYNHRQSDGSDVFPPPPPPLPQQQFHRQEDEEIKKILSKYSSHDSGNVKRDLVNDDSVDALPNNMNTQLYITNPNPNPNFSHGDSAFNDVNGFHCEPGSVGTPKKNRINDSVSAFSDTSSDISDATTSAPSASSSGSTVMTSPAPKPIPVLEGVTDDDLQQVEIFYRSHKTDVRVCGSLVNMYVSTPKTLDRMPAGQVSVTSGESNATATPDPSGMSMEDWEFVKTGIPVLVLNSGEHIRTRKLSMVLAERGTGFTLWEDVLNHMTKYNTPHPNFHTLSLSTDSSRLGGFSFDDGKAADEFAEAVRSLLSNPEDDLLKLSKKKKKKNSKKEKKPKYKPPRKIDISQPCCFVHVTKLERPTLLGLSPNTFPPPPSGLELSQMNNYVSRSKSVSSELSECSTTPSEH